MKNQKGLAQLLLLGLIAALLIAAMSFGYVKYIMPKNENKNTNQSIFNNNEVSKGTPLYSADSTVRVNEYMSPICSSNGEKCDPIKVALEVDLTEASNGDQLTGKFYIRGYLAGNKIGEIQITKNYDPFGNEGGGSYTEDTERILTLYAPFQSNFYLTYQTDEQFPGYKLVLTNLQEPSSFSDRWVDFLYENGVLTISFPQ
jgi:hypothetical protein